MTDPLRRINQSLRDENGGGFGFVMIWRRGRGNGEVHKWEGTVGEFLSRPENQSGTWLIDGGWGGPPGPIEVDWIDGEWRNMGYCGAARRAPTEPTE